jgi:hypothetical protein
VLASDVFHTGEQGFSDAWTSCHRHRHRKVERRRGVEVSSSAAAPRRPQVISYMPVASLAEA